MEGSDWAAIGIGILVGFVNTLAGSGSLVTLPFFLALGLSPVEANATNRLGIFVQSLVSSVTLFRQARIPLDGTGPMIWSATAGALVGAWMALKMDADTMRYVIGTLMIVMLIPVLVSPKKWLRSADDVSKRPKTWLIVVIFFILGIYGGFIQAGVGIFMLTALVLVANLHLARANLLKNIIVFSFTVPALTLFIYKGHVVWLPGLMMAGGQVVGAYIAARFAAQSPIANQLTRILLVLMLLLGALKTFLG
jgi:uncharacterized membrane protein YfcA